MRAAANRFVKVALSHPFSAIEPASSSSCRILPLVAPTTTISIFIARREYSAYKKPDDDEDLKEASRKGHLPRVSHSDLRHRVSDDALADNDSFHEMTRRHEVIQDLLRTMAGSEDTSGAFKFVDSFFAADKTRQPPPPTDDFTDDVTTTTPDSALYPPQILGRGGMIEANAHALHSRIEFAIAIATPPPLNDTEEENVLQELKGLRRGSQRVVLQRLLQGGMLRADPKAMDEWKQIQSSFRPPEGFRMKVVDVNRTCKGTRSGGLYRFSAMVVVGNGDGVLGWGQGKAAEVNEAVRKAFHRACQNLYPIPRFNRHTIPEPVTATFGKVKVVMYPKASGRGIVASTLVADICKLAGIHDIGVKIHGSRNPRNTVKCVFEAFDGMKTQEEILEAGRKDGRVLLSVPCGRFGRLKI